MGMQIGWFFEPKTMIEALRHVIKRLHYRAEVTLVCVRGYVAYSLSMRHWAT